MLVELANRLPIFERDNPSALSALSSYTSTRSLYDIISGCAVTTFLCAWVSIHLNTLPKQGQPWEKVGLRVRFLLLTVFAPELVIGWASMERTAARRIRDGFRREGIKISMTHAHLIRMGSFALCFPEEKVRESSTVKDKGLSKPIVEEVPELTTIGDSLRRAALNEENVGKTSKDEEKNVQDTMEKGEGSNPIHSNANEEIQEVSRNNVEVEEILPEDKEVLIVDDDSLIDLRYIETLSARRFLELLRQPKPPIKFPVVTPCELKDRSKTDALAKFITAVQVLWFVVQCIVRHVEGLAITQLELTTLALACLNAFMLWLWRDKPQGVDVQIPVYLLEGSEEWEKKTAEWAERKAETVQREEEQEEEKDLAIWLKCGKSLIRLWRVILDYWKGFWVGFLGRRQRGLESEENADLDQGPLPDNFLRGFEIGYRSTIIDKLPFWLTLVIIVAFFLLLTPLVLSVLIMGAGLLLSELALAVLLSPIVILLLKFRRIRAFLKHHVLDHRIRLLLVWTAVDYTSQAGYVGTVFGGLHCAGWGFFFPTTTEQTLWRTMSLVLVITPLFSLICAVSFESTSTNRLFTISTSYALLFSIALFAYTFARVCILALALELLRNQPASAYLAVSWTKLFPHTLS